MTKPIGKYAKAPGERKRYQIDYSEWLDTAESLSTVTFAVTPSTGSPVVIDGDAINPNALGVTFYASGGDDQVDYEVLVTATTSGGQIKEDQVNFAVRALPS